MLPYATIKSNRTNLWSHESKFAKSCSISPNKSKSQVNISRHLSELNRKKIIESLTLCWKDEETSQRQILRNMFTSHSDDASSLAKRWQHRVSRYPKFSKNITESGDASNHWNEDKFQTPPIIFVEIPHNFSDNFRCFAEKVVGFIIWTFHNWRHK